MLYAAIVETKFSKARRLTLIQENHVCAPSRFALEMDAAPGRQGNRLFGDQPRRGKLNQAAAVPPDIGMIFAPALSWSR